MDNLSFHFKRIYTLVQNLLRICCFANESSSQTVKKIVELNLRDKASCRNEKKKGKTCGMRYFATVSPENSTANANNHCTTVLKPMAPKILKQMATFNKSFAWPTSTHGIYAETRRARLPLTFPTMSCSSPPLHTVFQARWTGPSHPVFPSRERKAYPRRWSTMIRQVSLGKYNKPVFKVANYNRKNANVVDEFKKAH